MERVIRPVDARQIMRRCAVNVRNGSIEETGASQLIPLPPNLPAAGGNTVTVFAQSDVEGVPEPGTWTMMLVGFGLSGLALRRRRFSYSRQPV